MPTAISLLTVEFPGCSDCCPLKSIEGTATCRMKSAAQTPPRAVGCPSREKARDAALRTLVAGIALPKKPKTDRSRPR